MPAAALSGCALTEPLRDEFWTTFLLLVRYRRDLVRKGTILRCQIRSALDTALPGFTNCCDDLWKNRAAWPVLRQFPSAQAIRKAGVDGLAAFLDEQGIRRQRRSLEGIVAWAADAARKAKEVQGLERELVALLVPTPYVLLLSCPGLNVVAAADLAGELGPISH
jgi:hypothetical protein